MRYYLGDDYSSYAVEKFIAPPSEFSYAGQGRVVSSKFPHYVPAKFLPKISQPYDINSDAVRYLDTSRHVREAVKPAVTKPDVTFQQKTDMITKNFLNKKFPERAYEYFPIIQDILEKPQLKYNNLESLKNHVLTAARKSNLTRDQTNHLYVGLKNIYTTNLHDKLWHVTQVINQAMEDKNFFEARALLKEQEELLSQYEEARPKYPDIQSGSFGSTIRMWFDKEQGFPEQEP